MVAVSPVGVEVKVEAGHSGSASAGGVDADARAARPHAVREVDRRVRHRLVVALIIVVVVILQAEKDVVVHDVKSIALTAESNSNHTSHAAEE